MLQLLRDRHHSMNELIVGVIFLGGCTVYPYKSTHTSHAVSEKVDLLQRTAPRCNTSGVLEQRSHCHSTFRRPGEGKALQEMLSVETVEAPRA